MKGKLIFLMIGIPILVVGLVMAFSPDADFISTAASIGVAVTTEFAYMEITRHLQRELL